MIIALKTQPDPLAVWQPRQMMTEKLSTQSASQKPFAFAHGSQPSAPPAQVDGAVVDEEEPYTLTCLCGMSEDDGTTIQCERCDSWQHIRCYYPDLQPSDASEADFHHTCADCKPRSFDRPRAVKRMQRWLADRAAERVEPETVVDRKPPAAKRPHAKAPKKKPKPIDVNVNGNARDNGKHASPNDYVQPAPKKAKTSHRPSQSVSSAKRSPLHGGGAVAPTGRASQSIPQPPSPATTPPDLPDSFKIHSYSPAFCSLYNEPTYKKVHSNSFHSIAVSNIMTLWLREPERMKAETGRTVRDVFEDPSFNPSQPPRILVNDKSSIIERDVYVHWRFLSTQDAIAKDAPIVELNGIVGFQKDYCSDPVSLWSELTSPLPFVFFHPSLPLYIDTRSEGSEARYVRRSCKPNSQLATTVSDGPVPEYHFWLVSDRTIAAGEQITLPWDFRLHRDFEDRWLHFLGLGDDPKKEEGGDMTEAEYSLISEWIHRILSEYGGCACDLGNDCAFARFHRQHLHTKTHAKPPAKKKTTKKKPQPTTTTMSPNSTGHATNSRAASEAHADGAGNDEEGRSGSEPSKPPSRDRTPPARQGSFDQPGVLTELTDRDKRKVAMAEDTFRRMEQQPLTKKKKRGPDGSNVQHAAKKAKSASVHHVDVGVVYSNVGTNTHGKSASPVATNGLQQSAPIARTKRAVYVDIAVQTDADLLLPTTTPSPPPSLGNAHRRRIVSLSQRFLTNRYIAAEERRRSQSVPDRPCTPVSMPTSMDVDSPQQSPRQSMTPETNGSPASVTHSSTVDRPTADDHSMGPPPQPAVDATPSTTNGPRAKTVLSVQLPPVPLFNQSSGLADSANPITASPASLGPSPSQVSSLGYAFSPQANPSPSPMKKKLSLSDYTRRNKGSKAGTKLEIDEKGDRPTSAGTDRIAE